MGESILNKLKLSEASHIVGSIYNRRKIVFDLIIEISVYAKYVVMSKTNHLVTERKQKNKNNGLV
jgi:hypothetical protein